MCLGGGGSPSYPAPKTAAELAQETDNPFVNPKSGEEMPSWKPQELKAAKAKRKKEQLLAAQKAKADAAAVIKEQQQSEKYG